MHPATQHFANLHHSFRELIETYRERLHAYTAKKGHNELYAAERNHEIMQMEQYAHAALQAIKLIDDECNALVKERNQLKKQIKTSAYDRSDARDKEYLRNLSIHQSNVRWDI